MLNYSSRHLSDILRQILQQLEDAPDVNISDVAFIQLKAIILEKIAALDDEHAVTPSAGDLN